MTNGDKTDILITTVVGGDIHGVLFDLQVAVAVNYLCIR